MARPFPQITGDKLILAHSLSLLSRTLIFYKRFKVTVFKGVTIFIKKPLLLPMSVNPGSDWIGKKESSLPRNLVLFQRLTYLSSFL